MIFLSVGTQKFPFNRLLKTIDDLISDGVITEPVFAQTGHSDYSPKNYDYQSFISKDEFSEKVASCSLLITHSGVATIMAGVQNRKPVIVMPRLSEYKEHVDDHQLQIAFAFAKSNLILECDDGDDMAEVIKEARIHQFSTYTSNREHVVEIIRDFIEEQK